MALFAFLGPDDDPALREIHTTYDTDDPVVPTVLAGRLGVSAGLDPSGRRRLIDLHVDDKVVRRPAEEHDRGRTPLIGTTLSTPRGRSYGNSRPSRRPAIPWPSASSAT